MRAAREFRGLRRFLGEINTALMLHHSLPFFSSHTILKIMKKFISKVSQKIDDSSSAGGSSKISGGPAVLPHSTPPSQKDFYLYRQQRGVNLGSVFSLEEWLTPSVFEGAKDPKKSEFDVVKGEKEDKVKERLEKHWQMIDDGDWQVSTSERV